MAKLNVGYNPLLEINSEEENVKPVDSEVKASMIKKYGKDIVSISPELVAMIDFEDKLFINRIYNNTEELNNNNLEELVESIKEIGLINVVYLQLREDGKYRIISGLRRLLSCREILNQGGKIFGRDKVVIFPQSVKEEDSIEFNIMLERVSIDENTKRVNLTVLEQAYKFNSYAKNNGKTIEETAAFFNIGTRTAKRVIAAINYPFELKEVLSEVGIAKAEILNKIIKLNKMRVQEVVDNFKWMSKEEIQKKYKELSKKSSEKITVSMNKKNTEIIIKIKSGLNEEISAIIEMLKEKLK